MSLIENIEKMLAAGQDNAMLRYSLGNEYLKAGDARRAAEHLRRALEQDPNYSAAWKSYGKALAEAARTDEAIRAYEKGIEVAERRGDKQAAKEMGVFRKRLLKQHSQQN
ncbi:MAG: tetratricopeptide repeat protein [Gammaproteobacteria bacterium]|nr:tetratricopeptide repeat protein [Gammaproteobacteria bacterium]NIR98375.1 tetratricopeptide repeat protein [Gammaproteobacteria bacterium]NIT64129.1 tetratricopeptide repeat protein [Gammaproteobacteria bacterium]NIV21066.1 tetratricopeptide repeat protein [Gammaproteobacteria bacterium]NIY32709.1 tetratricopeptide repeat protein [Gammaproteobacteria bacterium]